MAIICQQSIKTLCERVAARLVDRLQHGQVPWVRPFKAAKSALPFNVVRSVREKKPQPYSGINRFLLQFFMFEEGWPSPAFLTVKQLQELNPTRDPDGPRLKHVDGKVPLSPEDWKHMFTATLKRLDVVPNLDGTGFVALGMHTSTMTIRQMSDLMELIAAFGAERGVRFMEPAEA